MRALLALALSITLSTAAWAQGFPSRPIRLVIPFPPAGITDLSGRLVAEGLRAKFNQPVIVENKPGAHGVIGLRELLKADADGYTLMVGTVGSVVIGYAIDANPQFDPMRRHGADRRHRRIRHRHGGQQQDAGAFGEGIHRLRQSAAGQAHASARPASAPWTTSPSSCS